MVDRKKAAILVSRAEPQRHIRLAKDRRSLHSQPQRDSIRRISARHGASANHERRRKGRNGMGNSGATSRASAKRRAAAVYSLMLALGVSSIFVPARAADVANVDDARIIENAKTGKEWLSERPRLWRQQVQSARSDHGRQCRETGPCLVVSARTRSAASKRPRSSSTGPCMSRRRGLSYTRSTPRPARRSGRSIPNRRATRVTNCVATSSIAASRSTRARSMSARPTRA